MNVKRLRATHNSAVAGLEWAGSLSEEILDRIDEIPLIEIIPENFFGSGPFKHAQEFFRALRDRETPVIIHSVALSLASAEAFKEAHFERVLEIASGLPVIGFSDHLCLTEMHGIDVGQLTPTPYNDETLEVLVKKIQRIQSRIAVPFSIENIAHPFEIPGQTYNEPTFIRLLQERTGVGLLLDLNNLYSNSVNFGIDPYQWIAGVELDDVEAIHLAGGFLDADDFLQDGHCERVPGAVWDLFEHVIARAGRPIATIVERTGKNQAGLQPVLDDVRIAQQIMDDAVRQPNARMPAQLGVHSP